MQGARKAYLTVCFAALLPACGGGGGAGGGYQSPTMTAMPMPSQTANFDMQAGMAEMVANGLTANVTLSGTVMVNGVSTAFTGSGTLKRPPGLSATFNGSAAMSQTTSVSGSIMAAGQTSMYSTSVTDYYASGDGAFLGEVSANEYDVAQAPIVFPSMIVGGSSGTLGTLSRYTDSTMSVSLGTVQVSYSTQMPMEMGGPIGIVVTTQIYNAQNMLVETDVTSYSMTSSNRITVTSASAQNQSGTVTITVQ